MPPTAQALADLLRSAAQADPSNLVTLSDEALGTSGLDDLVKNCLRRDELKLVIRPPAIPANPPADGFEVAATVPAGDDGFLALTGCAATLRLLVGSGVDVVLTVPTTSNSKSWVFSDSFPELAHLPYDELPLSGQTLVLSTLVTPPKGVEPKGLTFSGELALTGFFQAAAGLLGISDHYHLTGQISGAGDSLAFDLHADFGIDPKSIGDEIKVTLEHPGAGVDLVPVKSGDTTDQLIEIYLGMEVSVGRAGGATVGVDARIGLPLTDLGSPDHPGLPVDLMLSLSPEPDHQITLASLGALIAGQNWDWFFAGNASVIKDLFETVGFKGYTAIISLNPVAIDSMTLYVGTLKGWDMWTGGPTLSFDVFWTLTFLPGRTLDSDVLVIADLSYPPHSAHPLTFELTIDSDLDITGEEKGTLPALKLSDLNTTVFEGHLVIPEDLVEIQFGDFTFAASLGGGQPKTVSIGAVVSGSFRLFGTSILGVNDMAIEVSFEAAETKTYTATLQGEVFLGPIAFQADATISDKEGTDTVFSLHLVNETVGSMLGHFVHLIDPTFDLSLPEPWSKFLDISLDAFVLEVNVSKGSVALTYDPPGGVDLGFLTIDTVALAYAKATKNQASSTKVEVSGKFLGVAFGTGGPDGNAPLAWDPVNESPPAVPGKGSSLFDLEYLGLGQHIALGGAAPQTMDDVMKRLRATATPAQPGALPPFGTDLVFAAQSHWLIGAQFTVAGTVSITAIFNDPDLYGAVLELSGAKAEIFAGLRLEILYRKVNDVIGVYHIELKLPDAMRHLELGEVSVILPIVDLDIYTNGNFRVDFGFPKGTDFSRSFSFQLFPFVGYGGFYFALLDGATSSRVPAITNGTFAPVVEFGLALQVGVGKTISEGALSGGITVTVLGIVEGVFAWFHPTDTSPAETYHWVKGTIAITGRLYATIDFAVIQASIDVTANVTATLVIESHQPIYIAVSASVSVLVSVKVVFITIHLTFQASVDASFTIGSASPTPWHVASGGPHSDGQRRMLTGQRTLHTPAELIHPGLARARRRALAARQAGFAITDWPAVCVLPGGRQVLAVQPLPGFTKAHTVQSPTSDIVLLLTARTSAPPNAATFAEHRRLAGPDPATAPFNVLMQAMLGWGIYVMTGRAIADPGVVTASQLEELRHQLTLPQTVAALSSYDTLTAFLAANFTIDIQAAADKTPASVALFPMIPALSLSDLDDQIVDFATQAMVDDSYARKIRAYFDLLQRPFETASGDSPAPPVAAGATSESIATLLFCQYFAMLLSAAVKAAADYLAAVPYASTGPMSITDVGTAIGDTGLPREPLRVVTPNQDDVTVLRAGALITLPDVVRQVRAGDSFTSIAAALATAGAGVVEAAGEDAAAGWRAYQESDLLTANSDAAVLSAGVPLPLAGLPQVTADGDTVSLIATRVLVRAGGNALLTSLPGLGQQVSELLASLGIDDPGRVLAPGTRVNLADGTRCPSVAGDTVTLLAAYGLARVTGQIDLAGYTAALRAVPANNWLPADPAAPVPAGQTVLLAPLSYQIAPGART